MRPSPPVESDGSGSKTLSFRLDGADYLRLEREAKENNLTAGALAKQRALSGGAGDDLDAVELRARVVDLETHLVMLRADLLFSTQALLIAAGGFSPEQAETWVQKRLQRS